MLRTHYKFCPDTSERLYTKELNFLLLEMKEVENENSQTLWGLGVRWGING